MIGYLWVALGGALGSMARYGLSIWSARLVGDSFPWGTLAINIVGSFVIGLFGALTLPGGPMPVGAQARTFVMVGVCGGFTTFSSFSLQTLLLFRRGDWSHAAANILLSVVFCLVGVALGDLLGARLADTAG